MNKFLALFLFAISIVSIAKNSASADWNGIKFKHPSPLSLTLNNRVKNSLERIVGGNEAIPYSLPYQVIMLAVNSMTMYFCGGSLISTNYVLTSASCVYEADFIEVFLAVHNISVTGEHEVAIVAADFVFHEGWDSNTLVNDIAVIQLAKQVELNEYIQPIKLPKYSDVGNNYEGEMGKVSGWGKKKNEEQSLSKALRYVDVPVMDNFSCGLSYLGFVTESNICTRGDGGKGFCIGDAGGPLALDNVQIGVISFNFWDGCEDGFPSVYTRVTSYLDWIAAKTDVVIEA